MNGIDSSDDNEKMENEVCCLIDDGVKCNRIAGNASFSKRIQKGISQRKMKLSLDALARSQFICDYHKSKIQSARSMKRHQRTTISRDSDSGSDSESPEVDFYSLQVQTLRRYKKYYKVSTRPGLNKAQLADIISKHFMTIPVKEKEVLAYFIYTVKHSGQVQNNTKGLD
ncbi:histone deacetylase complex subunit SAP30 homolog [Chironomus tepperi]|uniref:histone deacetylase complex subunit SAP30 homolog n=1 Tax=Chironomus tepperi TaxID=113505 RepID=UPI00391F5326